MAALITPGLLTSVSIERQFKGFRDENRHGFRQQHLLLLQDRCHRRQVHHLFHPPVYVRMVRGNPCGVFLAGKLGRCGSAKKSTILSFLHRSVISYRDQTMPRHERQIRDRHLVPDQIPLAFKGLVQDP